MVSKKNKTKSKFRRGKNKTRRGGQVQQLNTTLLPVLLSQDVNLTIDKFIVNRTRGENWTSLLNEDMENDYKACVRNASFIGWNYLVKKYKDKNKLKLPTEKEIEIDVMRTVPVAFRKCLNESNKDILKIVQPVNDKQRNSPAFTLTVQEINNINNVLVELLNTISKKLDMQSNISPALVSAMTYKYKDSNW